MEILRWLLTIMGVIGVLGILIFIPIGAVILVSASSVDTKDLEKKKALKKKGIIFILLPFMLIFGSLISVVLLNVIKMLLSGQV